MKKIFLPKPISWTILTGICFLILMTLMRLIFVYFFRAPISSQNDLTAAFILGARYDIRYVSIIMMVTLLFSFIKPLDPFKNNLGKKIAITIWMLFVNLLLFFYTADFIHYAYVHQRLNASILSYIDNPLISLEMFWQSYHIIIIFLAFILIEFVLYKFISFTYALINNYETTSHRIKSSLIQIAFFILLIYSAVGNIIYKGGQYPLRWSDAFSLGSDYKANLAMNPMQSFFSSLNFRSTTIDENMIKIIIVSSLITYLFL